jgi:protein-tyrosine phosphatase
MNPKLYWIKGPRPGTLAISARPLGGDWLEDEFSGWRPAGVDFVVSLLTPQENQELELGAESNLTQARGLPFISLPTEDRGVPPCWDDASLAVAKIEEMLRQGRNVAVHCRQGIGRSGRIAAAVLVKDGSVPDDSLELVSDARGLPVPETPQQREWVRKFSQREAPSAPFPLGAPRISGT